jgi:hypothetical protein
MKKTWKHSWAAAIFGATAFVTTSTSQANVIVYWEEVTNSSQTDVVATWTGSLDVGLWSGVGELSLSNVEVSDSLFLVSYSDTPKIRGGGSAANSGIVLTSLTPADMSAFVSPAVSYGFSAGYFFYAGTSDVSTYNATINFDDTLHSIRFPNETLAAMNADSFSNTLAWTSSTGDTISYTTGSPPTVSAIPEPSSVLALGFLLLSGLIHRRRK